ncbi:uncharacterized protein CCOS01_06397 [Colletotrichum costaricense]|uniref:Integral membrane protein n=1 Tax=Colletotrichum costaricense TaxID=1209916 RepID=A0AAI9YYE1_9PEZI|nr:uncharacterized protein CCOS01_06397 [Colletotrichum costaricense]KAK1528563.1 integral membrane protein [Colletotrichum costaricense]
MSVVSRNGSLPPNEDVGPISFSLALALTIFLVITTGLRLWVRVANRKLGWDDLTIALAGATAVVRFAFVVLQWKHGNGRHRVYLSDHDYMMINMYGWWGQMLLFISVAFLKVSICLLILRIKDTKVLKRLLHVIMAGVLITNFGVVIILIAECQPVGFWRGKSAVCWPTHIRIYFIYATIGAYCVAGIWSNLELFLGIIAANLALTRSIYVHFFSNSTAQQTLPGSTGRCDPLQSEYLSSKLRGDRFEVASTMIGSPRRRGSETRSSDSEIPLKSGIQKKTEFWWTEDDEGQPQRPSP